MKRKLINDGICQRCGQHIHATQAGSKLRQALFDIRNIAYCNSLGGDEQTMRLIRQKAEAALE